MDNLVIFSSPWLTVLLICTLLLFTACAVLRRFSGDSHSIAKITEILSAIAILLTVAMFVIFIAIRVGSEDGGTVSPEEVFFLLTVISTVALTASNAGRKEDK